MTDTTKNAGAGLDLTKKEFERACELLPPDFFWGLPVTPRLVLDIAQAALANSTPQADAAIAAGGAQEASMRDRARQFVRDFSRDVGFAMSDAQTETMLNLFLRYAAPLPRVAETVLTKQMLGGAWRDCGALSNSPPDWAIQFAQNIARAILAASNGEQA